MHEKAIITFPYSANSDAWPIVYAGVEPESAGITFCLGRENGARVSVEQFIERVENTN
jgi:hypothetical protein